MTTPPTRPRRAPRTPMPFREPIRVLRRLGVSVNERLPVLVRTLCQGSTPVLTTGRLLAGPETYEVCLRCQQGPVAAPGVGERVVYWWVPEQMLYVNIHLHCLTPEELVWAWTHVRGGIV